MLGPAEHHETTIQPDSPKPAADCVRHAQVVSLAISEALLLCAVECCRCQESELSEAEELDQEEGPNNIARQIAQMTRRFGNAEKDPCAPDCASTWRTVLI